MNEMGRFTLIALILFLADASMPLSALPRMPIEAVGGQPWDYSKPTGRGFRADSIDRPEQLPGTQDTTERNKALVLKWSDALRNQDIATAQALVTDDWTIHGTGADLARGPEGLKQWQGFIDARWVIPRWAGRAEEDIFAEGNKVVRRGPVYRTWRANNKQSVMTVVFIYRIADGKIAEVWRVADGLASYQQIGARIIMPGTHADVGAADSQPPEPEGIAEQKGMSHEKTSRSTKVAGDNNTAEPEKPNESTIEGNKALVTRWAEAVWKKDLATAQALVTDDCVVRAGGATYAKGPEAIKRWLVNTDPNWSYGASTTDDIIAEGNKVARRTTVFARYKPNDRSTVTPVIFIYRIADGKIAEVWQTANYVSTYLQAGARLALPGASEEEAKKTDAEQELLKAKQEFDNAILQNDAGRLAHLYSDDYAIIQYDGSLDNKATQLERVRSGRLRYARRIPDDVVVRLYKDGAVIVERRKETATLDGKLQPSIVRATEVWAKQEGAWRLVSTQIAPIRAAPLQPGPFLSAQSGTGGPVTPNTSNAALPGSSETEIPKGDSEAEREILKVIGQQDDAIRRQDADALDRIWPHDFLFVIYTGTLCNKEYQVEAQRAGLLRNLSLKIEDSTVRIHGDMAVLIRHRKDVGTIAGSAVNPEPAGSTRTSVFIKRDGRWQVVSAQNTPILQTETHK